MKNEVEKFWSTFKYLMIDNDKMDDGSFSRASVKHCDLYFGEDHDRDLPMGELVKNIGKTWREYIVDELTYFESKGVARIIHTDTIVSTRFLCKHYEVSRQAIYKWRKEGCPTVVSTGKMFRYNFIDVMEWVENRGSDE